MTKRLNDIDSQLNFLMKGVADVISEKELVLKLKKSAKEKKPLRIKLGVDASASDIHLGTAVPLYKLKQFQELGHHIIFLIGDFTGMIGDPTGQSKTRKPLTEKSIKENSGNLKKQIFRILDPAKTEVVFNSTWCKKMNFSEVIKLASHYTVAQLLERDDFEKRYKGNQAIGLHEFLYPLIQGYDSVVLKADVEICGTDQRFNCLVARSFQEAYGQEPEVIIMMPVLEGLGTKEKMSKSLGNYIGITESAENMFAKVMSITDEQMPDYFNLCTILNSDEVKNIFAAHKDTPKKLKERLAIEIVSIYHDKKSADEAKEVFELKHGKTGRNLRANISQSKEEFKKIAKQIELSKDDLKDNKIWICRLLTLINATSSNSEARRLIQQKAVRINGEVVSDINKELPSSKDGYLVEAGSRKIFYVNFKASEA